MNNDTIAIIIGYLTLSESARLQLINKAWNAVINLNGVNDVKKLAGSLTPKIIQKSYKSLYRLSVASNNYYCIRWLHECIDNYEIECYGSDSDFSDISDNDYIVDDRSKTYFETVCYNGYIKCAEVMCYYRVFDQNTYIKGICAACSGGHIDLAELC